MDKTHADLSLELSGGTLPLIIWDLVVERLKEGIAEIAKAKQAPAQHMRMEKWSETQPTIR